MVSPALISIFRRSEVVDLPNDRSSHSRPTPTNGGIAPGLALVAAALLAHHLHGSARMGMLLVACGFGIIGLADNLLTLSPAVRLVAQASVALIGLPWLLSAMSGGVLWRLVFAAATALWLVSFVNAFNFMDGIDGISIVQATVAGVAWYLIGRSSHPLFAEAGLLVAAAALGFAPFNVGRARIFLGDVGSYLFGGALGAAAIIGLRSGLPAEAVLAPLSLYLADTGVTIVRRLRRHENLFEAHRHHVYQWFVQNGRTHALTTAFVGVLIGLLSVLGSASVAGPVGLRVAADACGLALLVAYVNVPGSLRLQGLLGSSAPAKVVPVAAVALIPPAVGVTPMAPALPIVPVVPVSPIVAVGPEGIANSAS